MVMETILTHSITAGNGDGIFAIDGSTGVVTIATGKTLSYATAAVHTLTISATDGANADYSNGDCECQQCLLTANPTISDSNNTTANSVAENAAIGTVAGVDGSICSL